MARRNCELAKIGWCGREQTSTTCSVAFGHSNTSGKYVFHFYGIVGITYEIVLMDNFLRWWIIQGYPGQVGRN